VIDCTDTASEEREAAHWASCGATVRDAQMSTAIYFAERLAVHAPSSRRGLVEAALVLASVPAVTRIEELDRILRGDTSLAKELFPEFAEAIERER
jgi:hypothetical protein